MPLYKTEPSHLREAIRSVLGQTFGDFEFLLLDDCPQDDRAAIPHFGAFAYRSPRGHARRLAFTPARRLKELTTGLCHAQREVK